MPRPQFLASERLAALPRALPALPLLLAALLPTSTSQEDEDAEEPRPTRVLDARELVDDEELAGFGYAVADVGDWDGDGRSDVAVSAPWIGAGRPGAVRVLSGANARVLCEFTGDEPDDEFGYALAGGLDVDQDGFPDLAIGARSAAGGGVRRGVVRFVSGERRRLLTRTLVGAEDRALTGSALARLDDVDGDGHADLVVGSPGEADGLGLARVYSGHTLTLLHTLRGRREGDAFGAAVASAGDVDADGRDDVIVGAPNQGRELPEAGAVHVFSGRDGRLVRQVRGDLPYARLGTRVAGLGDVDGDGRSEFVASSPSREVGDDPDVGHVTVFDGRDGGVVHRLDGERAGDFFGRGLDAGRDVDGDGWPDVLVGTPYARGEGRSARERVGKVEVFSGPSGRRITSILGEREGGYLGWSVALLGDGGRADGVALGAPGRQETRPDPDEPVARPGAVFVHAIGPVERSRGRR